MTSIQGNENIPLRQDATGTLRIGQSQVTLESVAYAFEEGDSPESILEAFPSLNLADIYLVLGHCLQHPEELESYLFRQRKYVEDARQEDKSRFQHQGLRNRMNLAKRPRRSA